MRLTRETVEQVLASFTPSQMVAVLENEVSRPHRELCEILAKYDPAAVDFAFGDRPETDADRYDDALEIQQARRSFRIVREASNRALPKLRNRSFKASQEALQALYNLYGSEGFSLMTVETPS